MVENVVPRFKVVKALIKAYHPILYIPSTLILLSGFTLIHNVIQLKYDTTTLTNIVLLSIRLIIALACIFIVGGIYSRCIAIVLGRYMLSKHIITKKEQYDTEQWDNQNECYSTITHMNIQTDIGLIKVNYEPVFNELDKGKYVYLLQTKTISPIKYIVIPEKWITS